MTKALGARGIEDNEEYKKKILRINMLRYRKDPCYFMIRNY